MLRWLARIPPWLIGLHCSGWVLLSWLGTGGAAYRLDVLIAALLLALTGAATVACAVLPREKIARGITWLPANALLLGMLGFAIDGNATLGHEHLTQPWAEVAGCVGIGFGLGLDALRVGCRARGLLLTIPWAALPLAAVGAAIDRPTTLGFLVSWIGGPEPHHWVWYASAGAVLGALLHAALVVGAARISRQSARSMRSSSR